MGNFLDKVEKELKPVLIAPYGLEHKEVTNVQYLHKDNVIIIINKYIMKINS